MQEMKSLAFKTPLTDSENKALKRELSAKIAHNIKTARINSSRTQQDIAEKAGLHLTYIGHLEAGKYHPSTFVLWKLAKVLDVDIDSLTD